MRLVIARCKVDYAGKLTAHLPMATRLILVKADGSVSIHVDDRAYKPLNWMSPPCKPAEEAGVWTITNRSDERLVITLDEVPHDSSHELGIDPGLVNDGVEAHLQELLADNVETFGEGWRLGAARISASHWPGRSLLPRRSGGAVSVEVKRRGD